MKRYIWKRKGLFALTLALAIFSDLVIVGSNVLKQRLVDAFLALDAAAVARYIPLVLGYVLVSGAVYTLSCVGRSLFSSKSVNDMRRTVFWE